MSALSILLVFLGCPGDPPVDSGAAYECSAPGDIDFMAFEMAGETCMWMISDCEARPETHYNECFSYVLAASTDAVEGGDCLDWCAARSYAETARQQSCALFDGMSGSEHDELTTGLIAEHFYTCDSPNYAPSGP